MSHPRSSIGEVDRFDGVAIPEEGRELVSRAVRCMALSPDYSIRRAFNFG